MSVKGFVRNRGGKRLPNGGYQGGSWTAYWYERSAEGSRRQRSKGGFSSKREAVAYLTTVLESLQSGTYVSPDRTTLGQYLLDLWLPAQKQRLRASTFDDYLRRVTTYIVPHIGGVRLQELDAARLDRFYAHLLTQGGAGGRSLSPKTVRNVHVIVRKSLQDAVRKRLITRNPALDADAPRVPGPGEREMETWTPEELRVFLKAVRDHFLAPAFVLAASTGMRRGEVLGLRWSDVDLEARTVAVRQTVINVAYEVVYSEPKTARGRRTISLDDPTVAVLREHRAKQRERRAAHEGSYEDHDLVFARDDGRPVHPDLFSQLFNRTVARLGLRRVRLHDLRHTYATLALRAGVDPKTVSARLGHATVAFTLDVYTKAVPQLDREAATRVAELIFGETDG